MARIFFILLFFVAATLNAQQVADTGHTYPIPSPRYKTGKGSKVMIDEAHHNFHRVNGRYSVFAKLLRADGYKVSGFTKTFTAKNLAACKILVIANALNPVNNTSWSLPNPSAFSADEINAVQEWVKGGGRLFLIADHMPFAGAAAELGKAFGIEFINGFAMNRDMVAPDRFTTKEKNLAENEITNGMGTYEKVDTVMTFTGSAFKIPEKAIPVLTLDTSITVYTPENAWDFSKETPTVNGNGLYQGAYMPYGEGKIVVFGEAAMFTAQLAGPDRTKMGLNLPVAKKNNQLLLNIIHWLDR